LSFRKAFRPSGLEAFPGGCMLLEMAMKKTRLVRAPASA
jgi:hypothetical protein